MNKHTSGPWKINSDGMVYHYRKNDDRCIDVARPYADEFAYPGEHAQQLRANATLISAAPDMLEVLKNARAMLPMFITSRDMLGMKLLETINTAIAKAEGLRE